MPYCHCDIFPGLSSKAVLDLNSKHLSCDPCSNLYSNSRDDISDPISVSVLATEDKNRQGSSYGYCQEKAAVEK